jgi:hypothetical protein
VIFLLDSGTLWIMLYALGVSVPPARVFASFMLSTTAHNTGQNSFVEKFSAEDLLECATTSTLFRG